VITLADVQAYDYGEATYTCTFNDEEFNLVILLLGTLSAREIFTDYADDPDFAESLLSDTLQGLMGSIPP